MNDIFVNMDKFLGCIADYLNGKEHRGFKNEKCKEMWKKYDENMSECKLFKWKNRFSCTNLFVGIYSAAKATIIFHLIHEILKPTSMKTENIDGRKTKTKRTIDDSISAFFHHSPSIDTWNEYSKTSKRSFQPFIGKIFIHIINLNQFKLFY